MRSFIPTPVVSKCSDCSDCKESSTDSWMLTEVLFSSMFVRCFLGEETVCGDDLFRLRLERRRCVIPVTYIHYRVLVTLMSAFRITTAQCPCNIPSSKAAVYDCYR